MKESYKVGYFGGRFFPLHNGHLYAIKESLKYVEKLYVGICYDEFLEERLVEESCCKEMPINIRNYWLIHELKDQPKIKVVNIPCKFDNELDWAKNAVQVKKKIPEKINVIFGSESFYKSYFERYYKCEYKCLSRSTIDISATQIRKNPELYKDYIPEIVLNYFKK